MEPSEDDINELLQNALEKVEISSITGQYHPKDIEKLKSNRNWIRRFLLHHDLDKEKALSMIISTLAWRKKYDVNDVSHTNVNMEILQAGGMFSYSQDKDGKRLLIIKARMNVKGTYKQEELHKSLVYWFERLERQEKGDKITIFFEMTDAGLSNLDMDFVQYLITLFRDYYPYFLNYIIIFEMSWILNAAWKVIKGWLPAKSVGMIKFVTKSSLKDFVPVEHQLSEWGGQLKYTFQFEPEVFPSTTVLAINGGDDGRRKVHFADDTASNDSSSTDGSGITRKPLPGQLLQLTPAEEIIFRREDGDTTGILSMTNTSSTPVAYKIKTTSPDKYRVRPSAGVLSPGGVLNVAVHILCGYSAAQLVRDKFLVMACIAESDSLTNQQLSELWKNTNEANLQQHRLRCSVAPSDAKDEDFTGVNAPNPLIVKLLQDMAPKLETVLNEQQRLKDQLKQMRRFLFFSLVLSVFLSFFLFRYYNDTNSSDSGTCQSPTANR